MINNNNIEVNYKNKKRYKTAKYPIRQPLFFVGLIWLLSRIFLFGRKFKVEKINMEGLKPPYMILSNHMHFIDFKLCAMLTFPHRVNNVVAIDGFCHRPWLMELIGAIPTRKFTTDMHLVKSIYKVLKRGDVLCMYPEARYSPCGVSSYIPDSVGALVKRAKVPVVAVVHHGNYLYSPFWDFRRKRKVPMYTTATKVLTPEQIETMSIDEINAAIRASLTYDEYEYQKENGILIKESYRAEGLHKILYQCPHCKAERKMATSGDTIFCKECGKKWTFGEDGVISAVDGETEFSRVPDWFAWEREQVKAEIERGEYSFSDDVDVYSQPRCWKFHHIGAAKITHDPENGFVLEGVYRKEKYRIQRLPIQINSLHVEYDWCYVKPFDCFDISTENDSFFCYPKKNDVLTKLAFATEILYEKAEANVIKTRKRYK